MNRFQLIIFDWDGTVMDSVPKIVTCLRNTAQDLGVEIPTEQQAKDIIGLSLIKPLKYFFLPICI